MTDAHAFALNHHHHHHHHHQFLILSSGLDKHGNRSETPLSYTHLDIAGGACENSDYKFGKPTATPLVGLTARFVLGRV
jgi:leucyl aminopeptidase